MRPPAQRLSFGSYIALLTPLEQLHEKSIFLAINLAKFGCLTPALNCLPSYHCIRIITDTKLQPKKNCLRPEAGRHRSTRSASLPHRVECEPFTVHYKLVRVIIRKASLSSIALPTKFFLLLLFLVQPQQSSLLGLYKPVLFRLLDNTGKYTPSCEGNTENQLFQYCAPGEANTKS